MGEGGIRPAGRLRRLGGGPVLTILAAVAFLCTTCIAVAGTLVGFTDAPVRVTLTMPCSRVDPAAVGHHAYGLDQVVSASCVTTGGR